jgi:hypothetical protein
MVDIVDRLRDPSLGSPRWMETMGEGANEIERLRKDNARLATELGKAHRDIIPWIEKAGAVAPTQEVGKVTVSRELVESVLDEAEVCVNVAYCTKGNVDDVHPALRRRYLRDMEDIWKLRIEMGERK